MLSARARTSFIADEVGWVIRTVPSEMSISFFGHSSAMVIERCDQSPIKVDEMLECSLMETNELFKFSLRS